MTAFHIMADAKAVTAERGGYWRVWYGRIHCPNHQGGQRNCILWNERNGYLGAKCYAGCEPADILKALAANSVSCRLALAMSQAERDHLKAAIADKVAENERQAKTKRADDAKRMKRIWAESTALSGTASERYLLSREARPNCHLYGNENGGWPLGLRHSPDAVSLPTPPVRAALIAACRNPLTGELTGLQRTFIDANGRALTDRETGAKLKLEIGRSRGCPALTESAPDPQGRWGCGEGNESSLAAAMLCGFPVWAAVNAGNLPCVPVPSWATDVVIFADHDERKLKIQRQLISTGLYYAGLAAAKFKRLPQVQRVRVLSGAQMRDDPATILEKVIYGGR